MECDDAAPLATSEANEAGSEANEAASEAATEATNEEPASQQQMPAAPANSSRTTGGRYVMLALSVAALSTNEERCSLALPLTMQKNWSKMRSSHMICNVLNTVPGNCRKRSSAWHSGSVL